MSTSNQRAPSYRLYASDDGCQCYRVDDDWQIFQRIETSEAIISARVYARPESRARQCVNARASHVVKQSHQICAARINSWQYIYTC